MTQRSLLSSTGIPSDTDMLATWSERIRNRIGVISRTVLNLESERQELLSMLWDAGLGDQEIELQEEPTLPPVPPETMPVVTTTRTDEMSSDNVEMIIDLVSDCGSSSDFSATQVLESPTGENHSALSVIQPTQVIDFQTALLELGRLDEENLFGNEENNGDLANLDPRELSFDLCPESEVRKLTQPVSELQLPPARCFKPWEWESIDWAKVPGDTLKRWVQFFGMKTTYGRAFMIKQLTAILKYIAAEDSVPLDRAVDAEKSQDIPNPVSCNLLPPCLDDVKRVTTKEELFHEMSLLLRSHSSLFERIILFESVELSEVFEFLKSNESLDWHRSVSMSSVKEFLDVSRIQYSNTAGNAAGWKQKRKGKRKKSVYDDDLPAKRGKGRVAARRVLRKSLTCP